MEPQEILQAIDHAEKASDRWLFLGTLALSIIAGVFIVKYFMNELEKVRAEMKDINMFHDKEMKEFRGNLERGNATMVAALTRSTEVIEHNTQALTDLTKYLEYRKQQPPTRSI